MRGETGVLRIGAVFEVLHENVDVHHQPYCQDLRLRRVARIPELGVGGFGFWGLGFGFWVLGFGVWGLGFGFWDMGIGFWGLGSGILVSEFGLGRFGVRVKGEHSSAGA